MGRQVSILLEKPSQVRENDAECRQSLVPTTADSCDYCSNAPATRKLHTVAQSNHLNSEHYDVLFALAYDRRRHSYVLIHENGGKPCSETIDGQTVARMIQTIQQGEYKASVALNGNEPSTDAGKLNPREMQVLQAVAEGLTNHAIASKLHITENTAKRHLQSIFAKLNVSSRTQAVLFGLSKGWISPNAFCK